jgi:uncharacterized protein (DUF2336 family)
VVLALACDQPEVASWVLEYSPLLLDTDLVDAVATGSTPAQSAIAKRARLPAAVAAAVAEVGSAEACLVLLENAEADIPAFSLDRMVERFGHLAAIREVMLARGGLPAATCQALVAKLSATLASFVSTREWLPQERALRIAKEACERATVTLAAVSAQEEVRPLVRHLRESGQLTAGLVLRALLSGNIEMFIQALAELSTLSLTRVSAIVHDGSNSGLTALFEKAALPVSTYPAFREAVAAMREGGFVDGPGGATQLRRRMVERVLTRCGEERSVEIEPLLTLLRRFAAEAAREQARMLCHELVADEVNEPSYSVVRQAA